MMRIPRSKMTSREAFTVHVPTNQDEMEAFEAAVQAIADWRKQFRTRHSGAVRSGQPAQLAPSLV